MLSCILFVGLYLSLVTSNPVSLMLSALKSKLSWLKTMPLLAHRLMYLMVCEKQCTMLSLEEQEILKAKLETKMKASFNKGSHSLPKLAMGDKVRIQKPGHHQEDQMGQYWCHHQHAA